MFWNNEISHKRSWVRCWNEKFTFSNMPRQKTTCCHFFVLQVQLGLPSLPRWAFGSRMVQTWLVGHPLEAGKLCPLLGENLTERDVFYLLFSNYFIGLQVMSECDIRAVILHFCYKWCQTLDWKIINCCSWYYKIFCVHLILLIEIQMKVIIVFVRFV